MPEIFYQASKSFKYCRPLIETFRGDGLGVIETFRGDTSSVMPERFYQASTSFVIPEISSRESMFLNNLDPGLKIAGV